MENLPAAPIWPLGAIVIGVGASLGVGEPGCSLQALLIFYTSSSFHTNAEFLKAVDKEAITRMINTAPLPLEVVMET